MVAQLRRLAVTNPFLKVIVMIVLLLGLVLMYGFKRPDSALSAGQLRSGGTQRPGFQKWGASSSSSSSSSSNSSSRQATEGKLVRTLYVIPGGGAGKHGGAAVAAGAKTGRDHTHPGYPEWTRRRTEDAYKAYSETGDSDHAIFLALSAGSVNGANVRQASSNAVVFESSHTLTHLQYLGVPKEKCFGDWMSWDTVGNAFVLRLFVEGILGSAESRASPTARATPLDIHIFISDFHTERMRAAVEWLLSVEPAIMSTITSMSDKEAATGRPVSLHMHSVNSEGIEWSHAAAYDARLRHEMSATQQIRDHALTVHSLAEFQAWYMLGGHQGMHKYLLHEHEANPNAGW